MFSVNTFYDYLSHKYQWTNKSKNIILHFKENGNRDLFDLNMHSINQILITETIEPLTYKYYGAIILFDQEPFNLDSYSFNIRKNKYSHKSYKFLTEIPYDINAVSTYIARLHPSIICHSERNSLEIAQFLDIGFVEAHYWYHGFIAKDWFRQWKHYDMSANGSAKRFGLYCRDASGSRKYRMNLLEKLIPFNDNLYFKLQDTIIELNPELTEHYVSSEVEYGSHSSASIVPGDCKNFLIHIVLETLFDTTKTHLTEKVFKPIVMKQPFILAGCPNSLEYLKSYGFKTFNHLWDESYDIEMDPIKRMNKITNVIEWIYNLSDSEFNQLIDRAQVVIDYNHKHFYSETFEETLLNELHSNMDQAIEKQQILFEQDPGGIWLRLLNDHYQDYIHLIDKTRLMNALSLLTKEQKDKVLLQYPWINKL